MKRIMGVFTFILAVTGLLFIAGPTAYAKVNVKSVEVKSVAGSSKTAYVAKGKSVKLNTSVNVKPDKAVNKKVRYKSSKTSVASVNSKGVIKGIKNGTAKITVTSVKNGKKKTSINVKVVNTANKITIKNKKAVVAAGAAISLKASVKGKKNYCKDIVWSSANNKIATVSDKGVVTGVKPGTVKIKASVADGSGKSAICKVKVKKGKTDISELSFAKYYNRDYTDKITVTLNNTAVLSEEDFEIKSKSRADGQYIHYEDIADVYTANNKDYIISLANEVYDGHFIQVTINGINGKNIAEKEFVSDEYDASEVITGKVGQYVYYSPDSGYSIIQLESGTLPSGLEIDQRSGTIQGIPLELVNNRRCTFTVTDEKGKVNRLEINFLIADNEYIFTEDSVIGDRKDHIVVSGSDINRIVAIAGGSGTFECSLKDNGNSNYKDWFKVTSYGGSFSITSNSNQIPVGTYDVKVAVRDTALTGAEVEANVKIIISPSVMLTGTVTNYGEEDTNLCYRNTVTDQCYYFSRIYQEAGNNVTYSVKVPLGTYDVYYTTCNDDNKLKMHYLERNIAVNADGNFAYNLSDSYKIECNLISGTGRYDPFTLYQAYLMNTNGKFIKSDMGYIGEKVSFKGLEAGNYIVKIYDIENARIVSESPVINLSSDVSQTLTIN